MIHFDFNKLSTWGKMIYFTYPGYEDVKGVYGIFLFGQLIYIGSSKNILQRIISHVEAAMDITQNKDTRKKYYWMNLCKQFVTFSMIEKTDDYLERENYYIELYKPMFNIKRKNDYYYASESIDIDKTIMQWWNNFINLTPAVIPLAKTAEENK